MTLLFRDVFYLDCSTEQSRRGDILVEGNRIGKITAPRTLPEADETIDGKGTMALLPAFVNCHTHAAMTLLRGLGEEKPLMEWLKERIWPLEAHLTPEDIYWGTMAAMVEMVSCGVGCFSDMYFEMSEVARASQEIGMRCGLCRGLMQDDRKRLDENLSLFDQWHGKNGRVTVQLGPHAPYTVALGFLQDVTGIAKERGIHVHTHFLETKWELDYLKNDLGMTPTEYLDTSGLLDVPGLILAHCVWLPPETAAVLPKSVTIVHNPKSNLKLGSGVFPWKEFRELGVPVALGTDGAASNNRLDMLDEARFASLLHKGQTLDPTESRAWDVLRAATLTGYRALGFENTGLIREGWTADFALFDLDSPRYIGADETNLAEFIVYSGSSRDVKGTMVDGKWAYRDGVYSVDAADALERARETRRSLIRRATE